MFVKLLPRESKVKFLDSGIDIPTGINNGRVYY